MKRRKFIASTAIAASAAPFTVNAHPTKKNDTRQIVELRKYHLHVGDRKNRVENFYKDTMIPILNKMDIGPIGVYKSKYGTNQPSLWIMIPYADMESFVTISDKLINDTNFMSRGKEYLEASLSEPSYVRKETILYRTFKDLPNIEVPESKLSNASRIYEMRIYESHSLKAAKKKIDMFNEGGEINIFKKTGLSPVFFGETLAGPMMPNLTYLLSFDNMEARDKNWKVFIDDPDWKRISKDPQYADTVSNITDFILVPASCSQV